MDRRRTLIRSTKDTDIQELKDIEDKLADMNLEKIKAEMKEIENDGKVQTNKIWKMKKKFCPKVKDQAIAKKDSRGNFITTESGIKQLYEKTYRERLKHNVMREDLKHLQTNKMKLFEERLTAASKVITEPWSEEE